jgi:hypothetical protein
VKTWVYTDLSVRDALTLEVTPPGEGSPAPVAFQVTQYSASFAANELPAAQCLLAIGREAVGQRAAEVHRSARFPQMVRAKVWFEPRAEYDETQPWPAGRRVIFEGFLTGFAYRKVNGKVHVVASLLHWLAALGFGSSLTGLGHAANPTQLNAAAVLGVPDFTGAAEGDYISSLAAAHLGAQDVEADLWKSIKTLFCRLAQLRTVDLASLAGCTDTPSWQRNDLALSALGRIEGPVEAPVRAAGNEDEEEDGADADCSREYHWGVPLALDLGGLAVVAEAVAQAIGNETIESYSSVTLWDKLVAGLCPSFGMAIVPMVDTAVVVADTPALAGDPAAFWKELAPDDYDSFDESGELHRPLRGVGVTTGYQSQTAAGVEAIPADSTAAAFPVIGGCHVEESVTPGDGMILFVGPPPWIRLISYQPTPAVGSTNLPAEGAGPTATTPGAPVAAGPGPALGQEIRDLCERFAHTVYVGQMLRGRAGAISGKLRFDIAPLSILKITASAEKFIGGEDDLAVTMYACVQRVTVAINAEAGMAGTTFQLSHLRTEEENARSRTSVREHPLFGDAIHGDGTRGIRRHGSPLIDAYDL